VPTQNLNVITAASCYFDLEDNHATRSAKPGKGASEGYAFEPLFRLYFYH